MKKICLGTVQFGLDYGVANTSGIPKFAEIESIIRYSLSKNILYFDTAQSYGDSEKVLGTIFHRIGCQKEVEIISKVHPDINLEEKLSIFQAVEVSLNHLGVDQLWGLLLHRPAQLKDSVDFNRNIQALKSEGLINNFGVSVYTPEEAIRSINHPLTDIIQVPFNILDRRLIDIDFFNLAKKKNKTVFIRSVFLQGLLLMDKELMIRKGMSWVIPYLEKLHNYLNENHLKMNSFSLKSVANYQKDAVIIIGVDSKKQLEENLNILSGKSNSEHLINQWWKELPLYPERLLNPSLW